MSTLSFLKMHGTGNDFVVFDARNEPIAFTKTQIEKISHRNFGIGCDQLIIIENSKKADVFMRIFNQDGSQSAACGNASRCVAALIADETGEQAITIETLAGILNCKKLAEGICVDMGKPKFFWKEIPLSNEMDTRSLDIREGILSNPVAVNMGNPHIVFFTSDIDKIDLAKIGAKLEIAPLFPERVNVSIAEIITPEKINLRVWERGAGLTLACGTAACATLVSAVLRGIATNKAEIILPGGSLFVEWSGNMDSGVIMTGAVEKVFEGQINVH